MRVQCEVSNTGVTTLTRFRLGEREYLVEEVLDQWYGREDTFYKVRADDHHLYILRHIPGTDAWSLESFRQE